MFPVIDKPTRVYGNLATLVDNSFINNADNNVASGNILYDTKDHFSQIFPRLLISQLEFMVTQQL